MKVRKVKANEARLVLLRMVADDAVCGAVSAKWTKDGLFGTRPENLIGGWAVRHYRKFKKAPRRAVAGYFGEWAERQSDEEVTEFVSNFLRSLSDECKKNGEAVTADYALDVAQRHFDKVRVQRLNEETKAALEMGDVARAKQLVHEFRPVEVGTGVGINLLKAKSVVKKAFQSQGEVLIRWGQEALDNFFADTFQRDVLIAFESPPKVGKSFWLQEVAVQGVLNGRNVAFFETGDQSLNQIVRRFGARLAGRPFKADRRVRKPVEITPSGDPADPPKVKFEESSYPEPMTWLESWQAIKRFGVEHGRERLKLSVHPNASVTVRGLEAALESWERDGWVADIVVCDYVDILAPLDGKVETRDQVNATWMGLRAMSERWHCCVVTATQTDAASYNAAVLTKKHFSIDRRKNDHVNCMLGINQDVGDKEGQLYRLNCILGRDLEFSERTCVWCANSLALANPVLLSCF